MSYTYISERNVELVRVCQGEWNNSLQFEERRIVITSRVEGIKRETIIALFSDEPIGLVVDPKPEK